RQPRPRPLPAVGTCLGTRDAVEAPPPAVAVLVVQIVDPAIHLPDFLGRLHLHLLRRTQPEQALELPPQRRQPPWLEDADKRQVVVLGELEHGAAGVPPVAAQADR